jgi:hypothetical protein
MDPGALRFASEVPDAPAPLSESALVLLASVDALTEALADLADLIEVHMPLDGREMLGIASRLAGLPEMTPYLTSDADAVRERNRTDAFSGHEARRAS